MPSLGNLNLSHNQPQTPPVANYAGQQSHAGMQRPAVHSPAEASIQSWAVGDAVQQPQPMQPPANPMGGVWDPSVGIKFGGGGPTTGGSGGQAPGTWKPGSGIKFG
jgi:programmed cell death 6-interacting protein